MKITFIGAGSTVFAKIVLGDCFCSEAICNSEIALYDIDGERLTAKNACVKVFKQIFLLRKIKRFAYAQVPNRSKPRNDPKRHSTLKPTQNLLCSFG